jgi:hypothetical protein
MCKRAALLALLALLVTVPRPARAQEAVLRTRITRLERELRNAEAAAALAAARRSSATASDDTISAGALRVFAPTGIARDARAAVAEAWPLLDATFGQAGAMLAAHPFTLVGGGRQRGADPFEDAVNPVITNGEETDIVQRLVWAAATVIAGRNDSALATWMRGPLVPVRDPGGERGGVYVALVTAPSPAVRRCYLGDMDACRSALGFVPVPEAVADWYDAPRRRQLVRDIENLDEVRGSSRAYTACVSGLSDGDCLALVRAAPPGAIPPPLPSATRSSLVRTAVQLGGRGAYARLLASAGRPIEQRLAAASGVSGDSVFQAWHAAVLASRPHQVSVEARDGWVALAWGVAFGLLALRSSRWR